jgi:hypothetical protein
MIDHLAKQQGMVAGGPEMDGGQQARIIRKRSLIE